MPAKPVPTMTRWTPAMLCMPVLRVRRAAHRVRWDVPGTTVRGIFLGPAGPYDPDEPYAYVEAPGQTIQEFSRAPQALAEPLALVPAGALLIITYQGLAPGKQPGPPRKVFRVRWRHRNDHGMNGTTMIKHTEDK
jgi:hypothetical protein